MSEGVSSAAAAEIGCCVAGSLKKVYSELEALLGVSFAWDNAAARVIIADGIDLAGLSGSPVVLVCGEVSGENPDLQQIKLPFALGQAASRLLSEGQAEEEAQVPRLDEMLQQVRNILGRELRHWAEVPPLPWGHPYAMALTHDIDILSLKEMPLGRTFLGYYYRSSIVNWRRRRAGKISRGEFAQTLWEMFRTGAARLGLGTDCWQKSLARLRSIEQRLDVRSSLYFMPFASTPGHGRVAGMAPANRASYYKVSEKASLLQELEQQGWEVGVHGIDAWHSTAEARSEFEQICGLTGRTDLGVRMHWLYFNAPASFSCMDQAGFLYDSTFGFNEVAGFRAGTLQPYHPLNCGRLWELPLHIQDGALLGEEHGGLSRGDACAKAGQVLDWARKLGGAVSLLWHNQSFAAPRFWGEVYERLVEDAQKDQAWIALPRDVLAWFAARRSCRVTVRRESARNWVLECAGPAPEPPLPPLRIRFHIAPEEVESASAPYEPGAGFIDLQAQPVIYVKVKGES